MPTKPDYWRIADEIIEDVRAGRLAPGDRLPSIAELREKYDVSPGTVQSAYVRLEALGVIVRRQGKGIFVTDPATWLREP